MFTKRIIPCLDVHNGRVVKGVNFVNLRDAGDPVEIAAAYDKAGADEVVFLDITASSDARSTVVDMVRKVAEKVFIPFTVGGGIRTVEDFKVLLREGADKISVNSAAIMRPELISEAADKFGSQCVVVAIDAKRRAEYQEELTHMFNRLQTESNSIDELSPQLMSLHLSEILLFFMRHNILATQDLEISNTKEADILLATRYIYQNYKKPLTLDEVASVASLSPTYFSKKFKQTTGMGFKEYLNYIRLKNAATALYSTDSTITDIALEYGFSDSNYFKDLFKKEYGMSPREFRKSRGY